MVNIPKLIKKKLSDVLIDEKVVAPELMAEALNRQKSSGEPLPAILQKMGMLPEIELARAICKQYNLPFIDASKYKIPRELMQVIPIAQMNQNQYVPLDKIGKALLLAIASLPPIEHLEELEKKIGSQLFLYVSTVSQVTTAIKQLENPATVPAKPGAKPGAPAAPAAPTGGTTVKPAPAASPASPTSSGATVIKR